MVDRPLKEVTERYEQKHKTGDWVAERDGLHDSGKQKRRCPQPPARPRQYRLSSHVAGVAEVLVYLQLLARQGKWEALGNLLDPLPAPDAPDAPADSKELGTTGDSIFRDWLTKRCGRDRAVASIVVLVEF